MLRVQRARDEREAMRDAWRTSRVMSAIGAKVNMWDLLGELIGTERAVEIRYREVTMKWKARQARREGT